MYTWISKTFACIFKSQYILKQFYNFKRSPITAALKVYVHIKYQKYLNTVKIA